MFSTRLITFIFLFTVISCSSEDPVSAEVSSNTSLPEPILVSEKAVPGKIDRLLKDYRQQQQAQRPASEVSDAHVQNSRLRSMVIDLRAERDALLEQLGACQIALEETGTDNEAVYTEDELLQEKAVLRILSLITLYNTIETMMIDVVNEDTLAKANRTLDIISEELAVYGIDRALIRTDDFELDRSVMKHIEDAH